MSTNLEAQARAELAALLGLPDRQGFVLPHFYEETNASLELVHRLKRASEHIDTWTWKKLCQQELEHVQFEEIKRIPEDSGQRLLYRQSLSQQLPWEPALIRLTLKTPPSGAPDELRQALAKTPVSEGAVELLEKLLTTLAAAAPSSLAGLDPQSVKIQFWSAPSHFMGYVMRSYESCGMTRIGAAYQLSDFEGCPDSRYLAPWPKLFGCGDAVIPDLRAVFAEVTLPCNSKIEISEFTVLKAGTLQEAKWTEIMKARW